MKYKHCYQKSTTHAQLDYSGESKFIPRSPHPSAARRGANEGFPVGLPPFLVKTFTESSSIPPHPFSHLSMNTRRMHAGTLSLAVLGTLLIAACAPGQQPPEKERTGMMKNESASVMSTATKSSTVGKKITNAMSAAPTMIAKDATVLDWPEKEGGDFAELRKGTSGWTCLPDNPVSPGNDPICVDGSAMAWFQAYLTKKNPHIAQAGIGYMLQGGSDASNTDPFAEKPAAGEEWMNAPPHIMIFPNGKLDTKVYGTSMNGGPWIMWADTPYQHLMVPVQ